MDAALNETARALVAPGKGILAADESSGTIKKRFDSIGCESTEDRRRAYREMLFTTAGRRRPRQRRDPVRRDDPPERLRRPPAREDPRVAGHHPRHQGRQGRGASSRSRPTSSSPTASTVCASASSSTASSARVSRSGARSSRSAPHIPSRLCIDVNAHALARYAALCQDEGIVPIVEPEVLMDGDHSLERCYQVTSDTLHRCSTRSTTSASSSTGMLLKPNMVIPGKGHASYPASPETVADATLACFRDGRARRRARHRVPVRRSGRRGSDREPQRDERQGSAPVAAVVLVRARAAGTRRCRRGRAPTRTSARARPRTCTARDMNGLAADGHVLGRPRSRRLRSARHAPRRGFCSMRALVQRVTEARVRVGGEVVGEIGAGLCVLVGVTHDDAPARRGQARGEGREPADLRRRRGRDEPVAPRHRRRRARRQPVHALRRHRRAAVARVGSRPRRPEHAEPLIDAFGATLAALGVPVATGRFRADMQVALVNDGPVTLSWSRSPERHDTRVIRPRYHA